VDLRPLGRFTGAEPEPRQGLRGGHMPGSINLPVQDFVASDGTVLPTDHLRRRIEAAGIDLRKPVIASCGSGTSACALIHALHLLGDDRVALYDGSWTEWGGRDDTPIATGPA
jgi:thiosulfate/3-mercaptopyruvate sulfurtransferase